MKARIEYMLELIEGCNEKIALLKKRGIGEERLEMRQERHLRAKFVKDLQELLRETDLIVE
ncbi:MAG: hypothetical protein AAF740_03895 [Bacteroidota bacterium]